MQASARTCRQHDPKCRDKSSWYTYCPSKGNSTNYFIILGWQIKNNPSEASEVSSDTIVQF